MNVLNKTGIFQDFPRASVRSVNDLVGVWLVAVVLLGWLFVSPLLRLGDCLNDWHRARIYNQRMKGRL